MLIVLGIACFVILIYSILKSKKQKRELYDYSMYQTHLEMLYYSELVGNNDSKEQRIFNAKIIMYETCPDILHDKNISQYDKFELLIEDLKSKIREFEDKYDLEPFIINNVELRKSVEYINNYIKEEEAKEERERSS